MFGVSLKRRSVLLMGILLGSLLDTSSAKAYVEAPMSLGSVIQQSSNVVVLTVTAVDREKNLIIYKKVQDLKGKHPQEVVKHNIGKAGLRPNEWKDIMDLAEVGKTAIFFHNGSASETFLAANWYQAYPRGEWWDMSYAEPFLLRSFSGKPEKLISAVNDIVAGKEIIAPCMVDGNKEDLHFRRARVQRVKASLKLLDYNPKRDFTGWGGEDIRRLSGMPGFSQLAPLGRIDAEGVSTTAIDFDGDGKLDICLCGTNKVSLLANQGDSFSETFLPGLGTGARSAVWADYNGDGKPDLLLATVNGPKLYTNLGGGQFRDDSHLLPKEPCYNLTSAAWIDADGDGRPDILLANGFHGLRLYRNKMTADLATKTAPPKGEWFEDVSAAWGLESSSIASAKGDTLCVADFNGDGKTDFLYGSGKGTLFINTGKKFEPNLQSGLDYLPGKVGPVVCDFNNDGHPDLFIPQPNGKCKLYKNDGTGTFQDVIALTGDLAKPIPGAVCAAWGDFNNDGHVDLFVGCLKGINRYFENKGDGTFVEKTTEIGLHQKQFNTQSILLADINNDGKLDLLMNNEGQDSILLIAAPDAPATKSVVQVNLPKAMNLIGSKAHLMTPEGKRVQTCFISGGDARGGQSGLVPRFTVAPGEYRLDLLQTNGETLTRKIVVESVPVRVTFDEKTLSAPKQ